MFEEADGAAFEWLSRLCLSYVALCALQPGKQQFNDEPVSSEKFDYLRVTACRHFRHDTGLS